MDIAYYLSELLGQLGEVNVPGLGKFTQFKINAYYNDTEGKFYPPVNEVRYDPHFIDDNILAEYIAEKKKISVASSLYFTEKYISNIKQQAMSQEVPLADLGWMYAEGTGLGFRSAGTLANDPAFYGYPVIELKKLVSTPILEQLESYNQVPKDDTPPPLLEELLEKPEEEVALELPVPEPAASEFDLENYLRELEAGAVINYPVTEAPGSEPEVNISQPDIKSETPEPVPLVPEPAVPEPVMDVALPGHVPGPSTPDTLYVEPYASPSVFTPKPQQQVEEEFIFEGKGYDNVDQTIAEEKSRKWLWISLLCIAVLLSAGAIVYYIHQQSISKGQKPLALPVVKKAPLKKDTLKAASPADSLKDSTKTAVISDTTQKTAAPVTPPNGIGIIDSTKVRYELVGVACNTIAAANVCVINYKSLGFSDAHVIVPTPPGSGNLFKVSLGTFASRADAINKKRELLNTGNIRTINLIKINPTK
jgi:cell division septation protein DedD